MQSAGNVEMEFRNFGNIYFLKLSEISNLSIVRSYERNRLAIC